MIRSLAAAFIAGGMFLTAAAVGADDVILRVAAETDNYCHLKFPAIREDTLFWDRPLLQDATSRDVIDFYGSCNHDPLEKDEVRRQRADLGYPRINPD
ncbi:hypothetical protein EPO44_02025 [bacterium]|nr:MAG: hypothetical protein EPO44_02025 [bacterium]